MNLFQVVVHFLLDHPKSIWCFYTDNSSVWCQDFYSGLSYHPILSATATPDIPIWCSDIASGVWFPLVKGAWSIAPIYLQAPQCRTILDELILPHKHTAFKMPRTKIVETIISIVELFNTAEDTLCVITTDALDENDVVQQKHSDMKQKYLDMKQKSFDNHEIPKKDNESIRRSLDLLARTFLGTHTRHHQQSNILRKKFDDSIKTITNSVLRSQLQLLNHQRKKRVEKKRSVLPHLPHFLNSLPPLDDDPNRIVLTYIWQWAGTTTLNCTHRMMIALVVISTEQTTDGRLSTFESFS